MKLKLKDIWHILEGNYEDDYSYLKIFKLGEFITDTEVIFFDSMHNLPSEFLELIVLSLTVDTGEYEGQELPYIVLFTED